MYGNRYGRQYGYSRYGYGYNTYDLFFEHPLYSIVVLVLISGIFMLIRGSYTLGGVLVGGSLFALFCLIAWDYFDPMATEEEKQEKARKEKQNEEDMERIRKEIEEVKATNFE